jgi:hypothetical protein
MGEKCVIVTIDRSGRGGEGAAHRELKQLTLSWARQQRLPLAATEVRLPRSPYRADVAAASRDQLAEHGVTAVFECKASREDFRRDGSEERTLKARVQRLQSRLDALHRLIGEHRPDLRRGESLFTEFDAIDLRGVKHEGCRRLTRELEAAQTALLAGTKFAKMIRWKAASLLYVVVSDPAIAAPHEVPSGCGLLVAKGDSLELAGRPVRQEVTLAERITLLERIAARAS